MHDVCQKRDNDRDSHDIRQRQVIEERWSVIVLGNCIGPTVCVLVFRLSILF